MNALQQSSTYRDELGRMQPEPVQYCVLHRTHHNGLA